LNKISAITVCVFSILLVVTVPYVHAYSVNGTRLTADSKMCLSKVDLCVMVKRLHMAPLKQTNAGLGALDVECKADYQLVLKATDNKPACVKAAGALDLVKRGWALGPDELAKLMATYKPATP
jgi:hypothetical protein